MRMPIAESVLAPLVSVNAVLVIVPELKIPFVRMVWNELERPSISIAVGVNVDGSGLPEPLLISPRLISDATSLPEPIYGPIVMELVVLDVGEMTMVGALPPVEMVADGSVVSFSESGPALRIPPVTLALTMRADPACGLSPAFEGVDIP